MKTLALVPARGGSKGIPRKNIKLLAGKPLIAWTIEAALASRLVDAVVVSTEDEEIADIARNFGAQVPFLRPAELARDDTPGIAPVLHALGQLPGFDSVMLLQPTSPLRTSEDIDECILLAEKLDAPAVVSVNETDAHPYWMYRIGENQHLESLMATESIALRQQLPPVYVLNGALYHARVNWLMRNRTFMTAETIAFVMPPQRSLDIDSLLDWKLAELLVGEQA